MVHRLLWVTVFAWLFFNWGAWEAWFPQQCNYMVVSTCEPY